MKLLDQNGIMVATGDGFFYNETMRGWQVDGKIITDGDRVFKVVPDSPVVSIIQYKMLFTSAERIATRKSTDPVIMDLQDLMNDLRTTDVNLALQSVSDALDYMTAIGLLAKGRKAEILTGEVK